MAIRIEAAARLKHALSASSSDRIMDALGLKGEVDVKTMRNNTAEYVLADHLTDAQIKFIDAKLGKHKKGATAKQSILVWEFDNLGIAVYRPRDGSGPSRLEIYDRE